MSHEKCFISKCKQCGPEVNNLYANFRYDIICLTLNRFLEHGLTKKDLLKIQKNLPLIYAWDNCYDTLRQDVNRRYNVFSLALSMTTTKEDVINTFKFIKENKLKFALRGGSHNFVGYSLSEGIVLDQSRRNKITFKKKSVKIEPGVLLGPLMDAVSKKDHVIPAGTCSNNGVTGLTLGGGLGFLVRKYGLTCDWLKKVEIILANGKNVKATKKKYSDLFWACQGGGGGNFGIVTSLTFKLECKVIHNVVLISLKYENAEDWVEIIKFWMEWAFNDAITRKLTTECVITSFRGVKQLEITGLFLGNLEKFESEFPNFFIKNRCLRKFRKNEKLEIIRESFIKEVPFIDTVKYFAGTGRWAPFFQAKNSFLDVPFSIENIEKTVNYVLTENAGDLRISFLQLGGALKDKKNNETAFPYRDSYFWMLVNSRWYNEVEQEEKVFRLREYWSSLDMYYPLKSYNNTNDPDLTRNNEYLSAYYGENLQRLQYIKEKYDPLNLFRFPQSIKF